MPVTYFKAPNKEDAPMRKRLIVLALSTALALVGLQGVASADPSFGPGNGQQNGDKCHPPGQTVEVPGCK